MRVANDDIRLSSQLLKLQATNPARIDLTLGVPKAVNNVLFYYNNAQINQGIHIKAASLHFFYNLSKPGVNIHDYDDSFIQTFTSGKRIALELEGKYYLLKHTNVANQAAFFNLENLRLTDLNGENEIEPTVEGAVARFVTGGSHIEVEINDQINDFIVRAVSNRPVLDRSSVGEFYGEIGVRDSLDIINSRLRQCFGDLHQNRASIKICDENDHVEDTTVDIDNPVVIQIPARGDPQNELEAVQRPPIISSYLFEVNGEVGEGKKVIVRRIIPLTRAAPTYAVADWVSFVSQLNDGAPLFDIAGKLYLPVVATTELDDFTLIPYPNGAPIMVQNIQRKTPVSGNASLVLGDSVLLFDQTETNIEDAPLRAQLTLRPEYFVPESGENLTFNSSQHNFQFIFVTALNQAPLTLQQDQRIFTDMVQLSLGDLFTNYFTKGSTKVIILNGEKVEISVVDIYEYPSRQGTSQDAIVTIRRVD